MLRDLAALELRRLSRQRVRRATRLVAGEFAKYDLLTYSSAIAYQVLYAVVPLALLALALLAICGLGSVYHDHLAPTLRHNLSADAFHIADRTARRVIGPERWKWATGGLAITVWGVAAAIRATMTALNNVYGARETRPFLRRFAVSLGVALIVIACVFAALAVGLGGRLLHTSGVVALGVGLVRWVATMALLLTAVAAILRFVPAKARPVRWISVGSFASVTAWLVTSAAFAGYVSAASYETYYGALAGIVLLLVYLHLAAIAFLFGVVVDSLLREQADSPRSAGRSAGRGRRRRARTRAGR